MISKNDIESKSLEISEFWRNNVNPVDGGTGTYTSLSGYGAKCKVEVISKSDLLRARGFNA